MPANACKVAHPPVLRVGLDTAQFGGVWPNEWPNAEIHSREVEDTDRSRDARSREHVHGVGDASNRYQTTGTATVIGGA
jgi:hypothetical protein